MNHWYLFFKPEVEESTDWGELLLKFEEEHP